jgi:probable rRNA maturation factor
MINFEFEYGFIANQTLLGLKDVIPKICADFEKDLQEITIIIGDDEWLLELNKTHLNHDYYTDIITFDYSEFGRIAGDLCVSLDRVEDNANSYAVSRETEFSRVVIHGVLHLCGLKDKSPEDQREMRAAEDKYLNLLS